MYIKIWKPGEDLELDQLFEVLRIQQHSDTSHPLYRNYRKDAFKECSALSITFDNDQPIVVGSILTRNCWPKNAYRIVNRFWKVHEHRLPHLDRNHGMTVFGKTVEAHVNYAEQELNAELVFISRQHDNWQGFTKKILATKLCLEFKYNDSRYLTCENEHDETCWQKILYRGNEDLLTDWKNK
jgi:hypothetical protein